MTTTSRRTSPPRSDPVALAGFALGITGLVAWLVPLLGAVVGVVGLVLSLLGRTRVRRSGARNGAHPAVGLVLSVLTLVLSTGNAALGAHLAST